MDIYLIFVIILFALAASDLVVGVSNDAVNFLNSAIGSKVGARWVIMIIASLGILVGVLFSSGMMEVARKGIFNPEYFTFAHVMIIFLAVMLTDILLLDLFNTFGLPTSTTVSIVFELLGAAVVVSIFHLVQTGQELSEIANYINTSKAVLIVSGIFLSIFVAFTVGLIAQFASRLLFSFNYMKKVKKYGAIWGGVALSILFFFIVIKGLKGSSFAGLEIVSWAKSNTLIILALNFVFWTIVLKILQEFTKVNVLKIIVFAGTFSLALAFASNDLVNFIGVPIAGFQSFQIWAESGLQAGDFMMSSLAGKVPTPTVILVIAGIIMTITLWRSKKAKTVTATEINLSRQHEGSERFKPLLLAKWFIAGNQKLIQFVNQFLPKKLKKKIAKSYVKVSHNQGANPPAFDLIRASVNLTIASMLIAIATSYKMPLSTTYVSFMVAMGTSLADKAWGNGSAERRVSGVLNVIGGWFMTALIAFLVAGLFATIIMLFNLAGVISVIAMVGLVVIISFKYHNKKVKIDGHLEQGSVTGG